MSEYLILAETIIYKNNKLTFINTYDNFRAVAMPSEFNFDMVILCGPKWSVGEHNLKIKAVASNGKEIDLGTAKVNILHEDFVYNAFLNNIKIVMDYSVSDLTFHVYDNDKDVYSKKYPVLSMLVPGKAPKKTIKKTKKAEKTDSASKNSVSKFGTFDKPNYGAFYKLKTKEDIEAALKFIDAMPDNVVKPTLREKVEKQLRAFN